MRTAVRIAGAALGLLVLLWAARGLWVHLAPILANRGPNSRSDFAWYYVAFFAVWHRLRPAANLYNRSFEDRFMVLQHIAYDHLDLYSYPPMFALLFSPLAALPYDAARQLWSYGTLLALAAGLLPAVLLAVPDGRRLGRRLALFALGLWAFPLLNNFYWGQSDTLTLLTVAWGLWLIYRARRPAGGGAALALGAMLKVTPAIIVVYYLLRGRLRVVAGAAVALAAGCLATVVLLSPHLLVQYVRRVLPEVERSAFAHGPAPWNQSLRGVLMRYLHRPASVQAHWADAAAVACLLALALLFWLRPHLDERLEAAGVALLPLLGSPSLETHHFVLAILPEVLLAGYLLDNAQRWSQWPLLVLLAVAAVLLGVPDQGFAPTAGRSLFGPAGRGLLPLRTPWEHLVNNTQHFWLMALLLLIVLGAGLSAPRRRQAA